MDIECISISKRYAYEWIFKDLSYVIPSGSTLGIVGLNGSGKSTLLRILLGTLDPSKGKMQYKQGDKIISVNDVFHHFSFTAPYMDLPTNFTMSEILKFHFSFRDSIDGVKAKDISEIAYLQKSKNKEFRQFSSGMQQRLKLALALCTKSSVVVLDEPTTNLDDEAKKWFHDLVNKYLGSRTLIIATNEKDDLSLCADRLDVMKFK